MITFTCRKHALDLEGEPKLTLYEDEQYVFDLSDMWCFKADAENSCAESWGIWYIGMAKHVSVRPNYGDESVIVEVVVA